MNENNTFEVDYQRISKMGSKKDGNIINGRTKKVTTTDYELYNRADVLSKAKQAIKENNLFYIEDIIAFIPPSKPTFYKYFPDGSDELNDIKALLEENKIRTKSSIRAKLFQSQKAAELLALYRLICTPEEHRLLNQQYIESKVDAKVTGFNVKDIVKFDRKRREEEED